MVAVIKIIGPENFVNAVEEGLSNSGFFIGAALAECNKVVNKDVNKCNRSWIGRKAWVSSSGGAQCWRVGGGRSRSYV